MLIQPFEFEVGDVLRTGLGDARLVKELPADEQGRDTWLVHYLDLDIEMEHAWTDDTYRLIEVAE
jgi:hypothetical protein